MAEGSITITILGGEGEGKSEEKKEKKEKSPAQLMLEKMRKLSHPIKTAGDSIENALSGKSSGAAVAVGASAMLLKTAGEMATYFAQLEFNRYFTLKEDYMGQNTLSKHQAYMGTAKSLLSSIGNNAMQGAMIGAAGGPIGATIGFVVGGVLGGAVSGVKARTETEQKIEQTNMQMNATNMQTQFSATRAGLVNGGRGTEY